MTPTICLNMIVKNESKIIIRLLDSVKSIIDCCCICDTGSTDNTIELIETWLKENGKTGNVVQEPFKNFGYNRTFAIKAAQQNIQADYLLFLDADMKLVIKPSFSKDMLTEHSYSIVQKAPSLTYYNLRLVKMKSNVTCVGVTHEYYRVPEGRSCNMSEEHLYIDDVGDGGSKGNKAERDIKLLTDGLEDPETPSDLKGRYYFYLANTYHDTGNYELAIKTYHDRINMGGWCEELWYSKYRIGQALLKLNKIEEGICMLLDAYEFHPKRIESLYEVIKAYRIMGKTRLAYMLYKEAKSVPYPKDDVLFINHNIYNYELDYELSIIGYYVKHPDIDKTIVKLLNDMPDSNFTHLMSNYKFYTKKLVTDIRDFTNHKVFPGFLSSTPCIVPYNEGYMMFIRHVNYTIENGAYITKDSVISCYRVVMLNSDFMKTKEYALDFPAVSTLRYRGIEDVKLFKHENEYRLMGTMLNFDGQLCIGSGVYEPRSTDYLEYSEIGSPNNCKYEKNWCFYEDKDSVLRVVYKWENFQTYKFENNKLSDFNTSTTLPVFKHIRGSTNGVRETDTNNIWFLTHLVNFEDGKRSYYHVVIILDIDTDKIKYTVPFKLEGNDVEYALGMIVRDTDIVVSYSIHDSTSKVGFISKEQLLNMIVD